MARITHVLGAGYDDRQPSLVFLSIEDMSRPTGSTRIYVDRLEGLVIIRTLAAALQRAEEAS